MYVIAMFAFKIYKTAWDDISLGSVAKYCTETITLACNALSESSWSAKQQGAKTISYLASTLTSELVPYAEVCLSTKSSYAPNDFFLRSTACSTSR